VNKIILLSRKEIIMKICGKCELDIDCNHCVLNGKPISFKKLNRRVSAFFRWYDLWIGLYVDTKNRAIYICPLPMIGIKIVY
jgi:hypothetical protein